MKIELTIPQAKWLFSILSRMMDGYFQGNARERKLCDNCSDRVSEALDKANVRYNFPFVEKKKKELVE